MKKKSFLKFCVSSETLAKEFCPKKAQSVTGSFHADNLHL